MVVFSLIFPFWDPFLKIRAFCLAIEFVFKGNEPKYRLFIFKSSSTINLLLFHRIISFNIDPAISSSRLISAPSNFILIFTIENFLYSQNFTPKILILPSNHTSIRLFILSHLSQPVQIFILLILRTNSYLLSKYSISTVVSSFLINIIPDIFFIATLISTSISIIFIMSIPNQQGTIPPADDNEAADLLQTKVCDADTLSSISGLDRDLRDMIMELTDQVRFSGTRIIALEERAIIG
jgi:hypothetical protein